MNQILLSPSILSADFACLGQEVDAVLAAGADRIHFDVMDNHFVPNLTIGPLICEALRKHGVTAPIDVHLMVQPVERLIDSFAKAGATSLLFHPEATEYISDNLALIEKLGCEKGLVVNPDTDLSLVEPFLEKLDILLMMSVYPGFAGQAFLPEVLHKVVQAKQLVDEKNPTCHLAIDGGIKLNNVRQVVEAGADLIVAGSAIFSNKDYVTCLSAWRQTVEG